MPGRRLRRMRNNPGLLVLTRTMPVSMPLFSGYVFGSAPAMPGEAYRSFPVPGLLVATAAGGIMTGMVRAAQDTHRGVMNRFSTLPMSRAAVPLGQAAADVGVTAAGTVPFLLVGLAVGWRIERGPLTRTGAVKGRPGHRSRTTPPVTAGGDEAPTGGRAALGYTPGAAACRGDDGRRVRSVAPGAV